MKSKSKSKSKKTAKVVRLSDLKRNVEGIIKRRGNLPIESYTIVLSPGDE